MDAMDKRRFQLSLITYHLCLNGFMLNARSNVCVVCCVLQSKNHYICTQRGFKSNLFAVYNLK